MRHCFAFSCIVAAVAAMARVASAQLLFEDPCSRAQPEAPVPLHGRMLQSSPDITVQELRVIDAMISTRGCLAAAGERLAEYRSAHPDDYRAAYAQARLTWLGGNWLQARGDLDRALREHPDFSAAKQLLASIYVERGDYEAAEHYLGQLERESPNDLWAYVRRLAIEVERNGKSPAADALLEVLREPRIPPNARELAAQTLTGLRTVSLATRHAAYVEQLKFDSATPHWMKVTNFGRFLVEDQSDYAGGRRVLQASLRDPNDEAGHDYARLLIAESYVFEAFKVSPIPVPGNAALIAKARSTLEGDFSALDQRLAQLPELRKLKPLIASGDSAAAPDPEGRTALCVAASNLDLAAVQRALDAGAEVDAPCEDTTALGMVMKRPSGDFGLDAAILEQLLQHGADPNPTLFAHGKETAMSLCAPREYPACAKELLPLLEKYAAKRAAAESAGDKTH